MHPEELYAAARRRPFVPVRLYLSDGSSHVVRHPDLMMVSRRSVVLALPGDAAAMPDRFLTITPVHVTRIEELDPASLPPGGGNGASA